MKRAQSPTWLAQFNGYIAIPHELLHVVGYWLVGKPCQYRWGDAYVTPAKHRNGHWRLTKGLSVDLR